MDWLLNSPNDLPVIMPEILSALGNRRKIALYGEMGAGKTTFVKALCACLGVEDDTSSPTFSLINEYHYTASDGSAAILHHLDLYRLKSPHEVFDIGFDDLMHDPWYCLVEWPQIAEGFFPENSANIHIEILGETQRSIVLS